MDKYSYEQTRYNMVQRARKFGFASLICAFVFFTFPFASIILGFFAILFAILSKGYNLKMDKDAKTGIKSAIIGIVISFTIITSVFVKFVTDSDYRNNSLYMVDQLYGESYMEQYGAMPSELINSILGFEGTQSGGTELGK